jgi:ergothioneine biosynthesis protein EgtB
MTVLAPTTAQDWYRRNRRRTRALFDAVAPSSYYARPIALRNPIVFYEGHLPAFSVIAFLRRGLGQPPVNARLETLFARGIDPESETSAVPRSGAATAWPSRDEVLAFAADCDARIEAALEAETDRLSPEAREGLFTALEHEAMHQETLLYMWHRLPYSEKRPLGSGLETASGGQVSKTPPGVRSRPDRATVSIPGGVATLGARRADVAFGWDNEFEAHRVDVDPFEIDVHSVTNADYLAFVESGGYARRDLWDADAWSWLQHDRVEHPAFWRRAGNVWLWRGMFEDVPLPPDWPVSVSHAEATAYARWQGRRLMTEPEFHRAAFGAPNGERPFPWGDAAPDASRGHFDFAGFDPVDAGSRPAGASAWGVHDLVGNGWEWTSTIFAPFDGFRPMRSYPEYSADFFDGQHYVMKGASPATARDLIRASFRNWFRPNYPYVYAKFRTVRA